LKTSLKAIARVVGIGLLKLISHCSEQSKSNLSAIIIFFRMMLKQIVAFLWLGLLSVSVGAEVGGLRRHGGSHEGGGWGGGRRCTIVAAGTTSCVGATGSDCNNKTALAVSTTLNTNLERYVSEI
jgi:hypothetical protein